MSIKELMWIKLMDAGAIYGCHQKAERSFFIKGYQFPVCARCAGILLIKPIAWLVNYKVRIKLWLCIPLLIPMLIDGGMQALFGKESNNIRRFITGMLGGFALSTYRIFLISMLLKWRKNGRKI